MDSMNEIFNVMNRINAEKFLEVFRIFQKFWSINAGCVVNQNPKDVHCPLYH